MNPNWKNFLINHSAIFNDDEIIEFPSEPEKKQNFLCPMTHLGILAIAGQDASQFLQGQVTCDVKGDITDNKCSFGALCTPKGRTISTFLVLKQGTTYYLILPVALLETVKKRLQMYILRSDVTLAICNDELCLIGLGCSHPITDFPQSPFAVSQHDGIIIKYPSQEFRYLFIEKTEQAKQIWSRFINENKFIPTSDAYWRELDIADGIPWLNEQTSEEFIPQMLNLDQLAGISFKKGCYTGQEIIARAHYLGKAKRKMYSAECQTTEKFLSEATIYDSGNDTEKSVGKVLATHYKKGTCKMLVVIQTDSAQSQHLKLQNQAGIALTDLTYPYLN
jgi:folate-binding protein YgfZ